MQSIAPLSQADQLRLASDWQQSGDSRALEALVTPLLPRILRLARRLSAAQADDLAAEGAVALIEAIGRWPGAAHGDLTGFVWPAVRGAMLRGRMRGQTAVSVPERRLRDGLAGRLGEPARSELHLLITGESFDETQVSQSSPASEDLALRAEQTRYLRKALARALRPLDRTERRLVVGHLLREDSPLDTLAGALQLSPARARALEGRALHKMRNNLMTHGFMKSDLI